VVASVIQNLKNFLKSFISACLAVYEYSAVVGDRDETSLLQGQEEHLNLLGLLLIGLHRSLGLIQGLGELLFTRLILLIPRLVLGHLSLQLLHLGLRREAYVGDLGRLSGRVGCSNARFVEQRHSPNENLRFGCGKSTMRPLHLHDTNV
jgi:hypothetical protein